MTFKAVISDVSFFKDSVVTIGELIDEGIFKATKEGFGLIAADRAMVSVVDFKMLPLAFDEYSVESDVKIPLNLSNLISILKRATTRDKIILELKENKLNVTFKNSSTRKFVLPLLDISEEEIPPIDQLEFKAKASVKSSVLKDGIKDAEVIADSVVFETDGNVFKLIAQGDISSAELVLEKGNDALLELEAPEHVRARYPIDYLKKMVKAYKVSEVVTLRWSTDYPMKLEFKVLDKAYLNFVLAPRVEE
ncbi:MAG: proliferating cell nuclear antigen (pcna) [Candidatus Aenigmarchaeota archaeon]|nr:proliferating cell nuclear antigen (pcna) [Candidatus Aenigmarchaeota archaeon]